MSEPQNYQERIAAAMDPIYWSRRDEPGAPALKAHAWELVRKADRLLAFLNAEGWTPPPSGPLAFCEHHEFPDELDGDEHRANCLLDPGAAHRLAIREGCWDGQGIAGCGP